MIRRIKKVLKSRPTMEGAGVHLMRAFAGHDPDLDPFLLLDDFRSDDPEKYLPGFPWHPHRGIETITTMMEGTVEHGDSLGNKGVIAPGDVQWMTAGSGIIHQEMPKGDPRGRMGGFQLWANLPKASKMMEPRYQEVPAAAIPVAAFPGGISARVICGEIAGVRGPVQDVLTVPRYLDVTVPANARAEIPVPVGHNAFAYVVSGVGTFDPDQDPYSYDAQGANYFDLKRECRLDSGHLVVYGAGDAVQVRAQGEALRFLLASGRPLREPVAWWGPIVMNTREELRVAMQELDEGTFVKHRSKNAPRG
jgi:hypothetical protein